MVFLVKFGEVGAVRVNSLLAEIWRGRWQHGKFFAFANLALAAQRKFLAWLGWVTRFL